MTWTSPRRWRRRRSRSPSSAGPPTAYPPTPAPGSPPPPTGAPSTGCGASPVGTRSRRRLRCCTTTPRPSRSEPIDDDRLRLMFICCHPALATEARIALTLRLVGGLTVAEIARAFLVQEAAMGRRITRAKSKIKVARIPYRVPSPRICPPGSPGPGGPLPDLQRGLPRLGSAAGARPQRPDPRGDPADPAATGAAAVGRGGGRTAGADAAHRGPPAGAGVGAGELVTLVEQDRGAWDAELIAEGHALVRQRLAAVAAGQGTPGRYQIMAAINAVHTSARDVRDTDWSQVVALYDQLAAIDPSPIVALLPRCLHVTRASTCESARLRRHLGEARARRGRCPRARCSTGAGRGTVLWWPRSVSAWVTT